MNGKTGNAGEPGNKVGFLSTLDFDERLKAREEELILKLKHRRI